MIVNEKNENILMLNEELEWYLREYQKEKFNHNNTKAALQILENRLFKDDDNKTDGEKSKKEEKKKTRKKRKIKKEKFNKRNKRRNDNSN